MAKISPNETEYINRYNLPSISINDTMNLGELKKKLKYHIQGIAQAGDTYIVLSSSVPKNELILVYDSETKKKVVHVESLPNEYEHAGGLGVLDVKNGENKWMIVVPVYKGDQGAILRYVLKGSEDTAKLEYCDAIIRLCTKAYAAGIARNGNSVVIAVVVNSDGNKVQFWTCDDPDDQGNYCLRGTWNACNVDEKKREDLKWIDENWGGYPNSISLIEHDGQIYFVGMHLDGIDIFKDMGIGYDWVDIYRVDLCKNKQDPGQLIKVGKAHVECSENKDIGGAVGRAVGPSFRWGGNARIQNEKLEALAVACCFVKNKVMYDKFCFTIDKNDQKNQLVPYKK